MAGVLDGGGRRLGREDRTAAACSTAAALQPVASQQPRMGQRGALAGEPGEVGEAAWPAGHCYHTARNK